jgi:hypothetical protein
MGHKGPVNYGLGASGPVELEPKQYSINKRCLSYINRSVSAVCFAIIAVCSAIHTIKHINTLCGHDIEFLNVKPVGT